MFSRSFGADRGQSVYRTVNRLMASKYRVDKFKRTNLAGI
jgi:hypothetical protein